MTAEQCHVCSRDISKPSLVRCKVAACPLNKPAAPASRQTLIGIAGLGCIAIAAVAAMSWRSAAAGSTSQPKIAAQAVNGPGGSWLGGLWRAKAPVAEQSDDVPAGESVDWTAATRVLSFSCDGTLSPARSAICSHWDLATVDYNLALVYRHALGTAHNRAALRADQDRWLAELDRLDAKPDAVLDHYRRRIDQLQSNTPARAAE